MAIRKKLDRAAQLVNKMTGATNLARYIGEGIAKRKNPSVQRTVTGKQALKSAGQTALSIGTVMGVGSFAKLATKAKGVKATVHGAGNKFIKRTYSGYEKEAYRQAAKRNATKKR